MSDQAQAQRFQIYRIYAKDISLETPNTPHIFRQQAQTWQPEINVQMQAESERLDDNTHEIVLTITITAKQDDQTAFLVELQQAGIFGLENFDSEQLDPMLKAYCPNVLFPYARETIDSLLVRAGFPPLQLAPVNFDALYAQRQQQDTEPAAAPPVQH